MNHYVHFRYHDEVNALIGNHRYRYEKLKRSEIDEAVKSLVGKGYGQFCIRELGTSEPWRELAVERDLASGSVRVFDDKTNAAWWAGRHP